MLQLPMHAVVSAFQSSVVLCNRRYISHSLFSTDLKCKKRKKFIKNWSIKRQLGNFFSSAFLCEAL